MPVQTKYSEFPTCKSFSGNYKKLNYTLKNDSEENVILIIFKMATAAVLILRGTFVAVQKNSSSVNSWVGLGLM